MASNMRIFMHLLRHIDCVQENNSEFAVNIYKYTFYEGGADFTGMYSVLIGSDDITCGGGRVFGGKN